MAMESFICNKRVVKNGKVVAHPGQRMTEAKAKALGLIEPPAPVKSAAPRRRTSKKNG